MNVAWNYISLMVMLKIKGGIWEDSDLLFMMRCVRWDFLPAPLPSN